jgi:hypothetical protein
MYEVPVVIEVKVCGVNPVAIVLPVLLYRTVK